MTKKQYRQFLMVLLAVTFCTVTGNSFGQGRPAALGPDTLYVTDELDGTVKSFSTQDGSRLGFTTQKGQLRAPMGLFVAGGELVVVNQNAGEAFQRGDSPQPAQGRKARRATGRSTRLGRALCASWRRST